MNAVHDVAHQKLARLEGLLRVMGEVIVAYSGGVDSSFLLWAAHKVLGERALSLCELVPVAITARFITKMLRFQSPTR